MRRIGTITTALGLIYYGIWLAFRNINPPVAEILFKWWPIIFILLGVEILINTGIGRLEKRNGFNVGVVFIIILFLFTNMFYGVSGKIDRTFDFFRNGGFTINSDVNLKEIDVSKSISLQNKKFQFSTNNANIEIKKSTDDNVKTELNVYVDKNSNINSYNLNESNNGDIKKLDINEDYVKKVSGTIYIPDGISMEIDVNNLNINSDDQLGNTNFNIQSNNGKYDLDSAAELNLNFNNGAVNLKDIKTVKLKGDNASFKLNGNIEDIDIQSANGSIEINNTICNNVSIKTNNSAVKINTQDKNIDADLSIGMGECRFNNDRINRGNLRKTAGDGSHKVKITADLGSITVTSQE